MTVPNILAPRVWCHDIRQQWNWKTMGQNSLFLVYWVQLPHPRHRSPSAALMQNRAAHVMNSYALLRMSLVNLSRMSSEAQVLHRATLTRKIGVILGVPTQNLIGMAAGSSKKYKAMPTPSTLNAATDHHVYCVAKPGLPSPTRPDVSETGSTLTGKLHVLGLLDAREPTDVGYPNDVDSVLLADLRWNNPLTEIVRCGIDGFATVNGTGRLDVQRGRELCCFA